MGFEPDYERDHKEVVSWARELLKQNDWLILDTETTGLHSEAEIVQIAIGDADGHVIFDSMVKPEGTIDADATQLHGIDGARVAYAPSFPAIHNALVDILDGRKVIIFNAPFDTMMLAQDCDRHGLEWIVFGQTQDAMLQYAQWCGDWNDYHGNYRWQKLPSGDHSARGDVLATYRLIKRMAEFPPELTSKPIDKGVSI